MANMKAWLEIKEGSALYRRYPLKQAGNEKIPFNALF
jgi:hypothetical protein